MNNKIERIRMLIRMSNIIGDEIQIRYLNYLSAKLMRRTL